MRTTSQKRAGGQPPQASLMQIASGMSPMIVYLLLLYHFRDWRAQGMLTQMTTQFAVGLPSLKERAKDKSQAHFRSPQRYWHYVYHTVAPVVFLLASAFCGFMQEAAVHLQLAPAMTTEEETEGAGGALVVQQIIFECFAAGVIAAGLQCALFGAVPDAREQWGIPSWNPYLVMNASSAAKFVGYRLLVSSLVTPFIESLFYRSVVLDLLGGGLFAHLFSLLLLAGFKNNSAGSLAGGLIFHGMRHRHGIAATIITHGTCCLVEGLYIVFTGKWEMW